MLAREFIYKIHPTIALAMLLALTLPSLPGAQELGPAYSNAPYYEVSGQRVYFDRIIITRNLGISAVYGRTQKGMIEWFLYEFLVHFGPSPRTHVKDAWYKTPIPNGTTLVIFGYDFLPEQPYRWVAVRRLGTEFLCLRTSHIDAGSSGSYCKGSWKVGKSSVSLEIDRATSSHEFLLYRFSIH